MLNKSLPHHRPKVAGKTPDHPQGDHLVWYTSGSVAGFAWFFAGGTCPISPRKARRDTEGGDVLGYMVPRSYPSVLSIACPAAFLFVLFEFFALRFFSAFIGGVIALPCVP
jgi:hypothetical protein